VTANIVRATGGEVNDTAFFDRHLTVYFENVSLCGAGEKDGLWKSTI